MLPAEDGNRQSPILLPVGAFVLVNTWSLYRQALSAANTAYDQVNKAAKQVVELAEANVAAATKTARSAGKKAA